MAEGLRQAVGLQNVTINGVAPQTHFAQVLVEADYRMKLIGIGLEPPPVRMQSYVDRASSKSSSNSLQRWYFVPDYEALRLSDDGLAMRLEGNGVKLVSADEVVLADGKRASTKSVDKASRGFVRDFTEKYAAIAERAPVYGQLRNLVDLLVAAAFLQEHDYYGQADWKATVFGDEQILSVEQHPSPRQVETAVNAVWKGARLMFPMGGGVRIQARDALSDNNVVSDDSGSVAREREEGVSFDKLDPCGGGTEFCESPAGRTPLMQFGTLLHEPQDACRANMPFPTMRAMQVVAEIALVEYRGRNPWVEASDAKGNAVGTASGDVKSAQYRVVGVGHQCQSSYWCQGRRKGSSGLQPSAIDGRRGENNLGTNRWVIRWSQSSALQTAPA